MMVSASRPPAAETGARGPRSPWIGFSAVAVGVFMSTLDGSIVNVALPTLTRELAAGRGGVEWVVAAYLLVISAFLLTAGRLGDLIGRRRVYVSGLLIFTLGSVLCGLASGLWPLVGARAIQALGSSMTMSMGPAIVTAIFPPEQRGRALGAIASCVALGLTAGPSLGGIIVGALSWRFIFFVNVPVGLAGVLWAMRVLPGEGRDTAGRPLDVRGAALLAVTLSAGVAAVQGAPRSLSRSVVLGAVSLAGLLLASRHLRRAPSPVLDLKLFRSRGLTAGVAAALLSYGGFFTSNFLTPFFLTRVKGLGTQELGAMLTAVPLTLSVVSPLAGWLSDRFGPRVLGPIGAITLASGLILLGSAGAETSLVSMASRLALCGVGMGLFQPPNNSAVMGVLARDHLGSGSGVLATARNLGMVTGIALSSALFFGVGGMLEGGPLPLFLSGYRTALFSGAVLALFAALASLARDPPRAPVPKGA